MTNSPHHADHLPAPDAALRPRYRATAGVAVLRDHAGGKRYLASPVNADLSMAIEIRAGAPVPGRLFAGLLSVGPDPDGHGYKEVSAQGYERQSVELFPGGRSRLAVPHKVIFEMEPIEAPTHIAIFTDRVGGELLWFGGLRGSRYAAAPAAQLVFPAFRISLASPAGGRRPASLDR